ncbi:imidazole glycerol phosphate synthase subunit HisF [Candidatus Micrarchaeota archaeon]|nr:imidazole glycerol phosphate synthase subunit HisF [Candidatus Micrarchaeota archaeon]
MLAKRVIPCLDCDLSVANGRVVKGVEFQNIRYAGVPWELAAKYSEAGADEIVFLDITASADRRETMVKVVERTAESVFVPLTVGGGIRSVEDFKRMLKAGADKCSVNTAALQRPELIREASRVVGSQAVVVAIDAKMRSKRFGKRMGDGHADVSFECAIFGGRQFTGVDAVEWARKAEELGAGEILLTSMDRDGTSKGYDLLLTKTVSEAVGIPVIASGGAGELSHFVDVFEKGKADAALLASLLHFNKLSIQEIKAYLKKNNVLVRS